MTARERHSAGGATLAVRPAPTPARAVPTPPPDLPSWEELYRSLPSAGQEELLALARGQGLLYTHQLPVIDPANLLQRRQFLAQLLAGKVRDLPPVPSCGISLFDKNLDSVQQEAVTRALATPDVALIQGLPGSGKSRVAAEIVHQAAARGERILLLSATTAALDRVLEQVGRREGVWAIRTLHPGETVEGLTACVRACTTEERTRRLREITLHGARSRAESLRQQQEHRAEERVVWDRLDVLSLRAEAIEKRIVEINTCRPLIAEEASTCWDKGEAGRACVQRRDHEFERLAAEKADLDRQRHALHGERSPLASEYESLRPLVEARRGASWLSPMKWKAVLHGGLMERAAELEKLLAGLRERETALNERIHQLERERPESETRFENERREIVERETTQRVEQIDREDAALRTDAETIRQQWQEIVQTLPESIRPQDASRRTEAKAAWEQWVEQEVKQADFAIRWSTALEEAAPTLESRLPAYANLVALTPAALHAEDANGDGQPTFDLLLVDEADHLSEADLTLAARRTRRWVLIGEPDAPTRPGQKVLAVRPGPFARLWQQLHASPRRGTIRWSRAEGRLCCRLRPVAADQRHWIQVEPVADRPEVELHILAVPRQDPLLVEVRFPATMPVLEAKSYIFREMQEVVAHARGPACLWSQGRESLCLQLGNIPPEEWRPEERLPLEEGVCEIVRSGDDSACETLGFEFDPTWPRPRAEAWLEGHLGLHDSGRTTYLGRVHRCSLGLASFLSRVLFRDQGLPVCAGEDGVRLVPVPMLDNSDPRRKARDSSNGPRPAPRPGAGYESDLSAAPPPDRLPSDLRAALPRQGLVNFPEATAVVRAIEALLTDSAFRSEASSWSGNLCSSECRHPASDGSFNAVAESHNPAVIVTALYEAQVDLLRLLLARSTILKDVGLTRITEGRFRLKDIEILVAEPPALRQRECLTLFLSMTRSHTHRAVALGEQAYWLPLALTRACGRLTLFTDLGTLTRRTQWQGAVDYLDESAGERERELAVQLLRCPTEGESHTVSTVESAGR